MPRFSDKLSITLPETSFETYNCEKPGLEVEISKEELLDMYNKMTVMRRMEMVADGLYKAKKIRGFCHLCNGQVKHLTFLLLFFSHSLQTILYHFPFFFIYFFIIIFFWLGVIGKI